LYTQECTVTAQGTALANFGIIGATLPAVTGVTNEATLEPIVQLSADNKLVSLQENATIKDENDNSQVVGSINITMTEQGNTPPSPSDFNRPNSCNAPNSNNQVENDNQGLVCTGTIPSICF
jgi:hypothetical protein